MKDSPISPWFRLIWPKQLCQEIDRLYEDDALNYRAVENLESSTSGLLVILFLLSSPLFFIYLFSAYWLEAMIAMLFVPLVVAYDIRFVFRREMAVYIYGKAGEIVVKKIRGGGWFKQFLYGYLPGDLNTYKIKIEVTPEVRSDKRDLVNLNATFPVYYCPNKQFRAMPDIDIIKLMRCLDKRKISNYA